MTMRFADHSEDVAGDVLRLAWCVDLGEGGGVMLCCARFAADAAIEGWPVWLAEVNHRPDWLKRHDELRRPGSDGRPRWWRDLLNASKPVQIPIERGGT